VCEGAGAGGADEGAGAGGADEGAGAGGGADEGARVPGDAGGGDNDPPHPVICTGVALGNEGVDRQIVERVNISQIVKIISYRGEGADISGGTKEIFTNQTHWFGPTGRLWSRKIAGVTKASWDDLLTHARAKARDVLRYRCGYSQVDMRDLSFGAFTLLISDSRTAYKRAQPPHVDIGFHQAQFIMAMTPDSPSTNLYNGPPHAFDLDTEAHYTPKEKAFSDERISEMVPDGLLPYILPILQPRVQLLTQMRPAAPRKLQPGEFTYIAGPGIHGGPESLLGEFRVVLFFTTYLRRKTIAYNTDTQYLPYNMTKALNSAHLFVRVMLDWIVEKDWGYQNEFANLAEFVEAHDEATSIAHVRLELTERD
jgi:hypothetical protein